MKSSVRISTAGGRFASQQLRSIPQLSPPANRTQQPGRTGPPKLRHLEDENSRLKKLGSLSFPELALDALHCFRTFLPASCCFRIPMICSSVNLPFFIASFSF